MHTSVFLAAWNPTVTGDHFFAAAIAMAILLLAVLVATVVLTVKFIRARRSHKQQTAQSVSEVSDGYTNYAFAPMILLGAVPQLANTMLYVFLIGLAAVSLLLLILLVVFRACGYELLPRAARGISAEKQTTQDVLDAYAEQEIEEETDSAADVDAAEEEAPDYTTAMAAIFESEAQKYASEEEDASEEQEDAFDLSDAFEEAVETVEEAEEIEEIEEAEEEALVGEETVEAEEPAALAGEIIPAASISTGTETNGQASDASGASGPIKIVEKVVTETYKEVIREVPVEGASNENSSDRVIEKLTDLLEQALQNQRPAEAAPAFAAVDADTAVRVTGSSDEDEDDEDEDDETDEMDPEDRDDIDDEENDIADDRFTGNERIIGFDEDTGMYIVAHYRKSFEAKLIQSRPNIKKYYSELKNALLSYKGSKSRISWTADSFHNGREQIAKINVKTRILEIYLALDPATLEGTVYRGKDVGSKKKYADTPFQYKVRTPRKFKWAMELVQRTCEEHGLSPIDIEPIAYDEQYPFDTTENLVARKLIKEYIRQEKPATTFELAEDHKTAVPDEDPSVIPANANFSWEFDNDMLNDPARNVEPDPEPVPDPIPEPVEEPTIEPAPAAPTTVYKETVKVTEMRYTERYYANGDVAVTDAYNTVSKLTDGVQATEEDSFTTDKFDGADPFEDYRSDDLIPEEASEEDADEEGAEEEEIEIFEEAEDEAETEEIEEIEEIEEVDEQPVWVELGDEENGEDVEYEEVIEYVEADDENAEDVEYEEVIEYVEADDENAEDVEYEEVIEYVEVDDENAEDVEYEEVIEYVEVDDENAEDVEYEEIVEYVEVDDENAEDVEYEEIVEEEISEPQRSAQPAANPDVAVISIRTLEANFAQGATVNLEKLKAVGLVLPTAKYLNIYGSGPMSKALTVEANKFTLDAVIAIDEAGGNSIMLT